MPVRLYICVCSQFGIPGNQLSTAWSYTRGICHPAKSSNDYIWHHFDTALSKNAAWKIIIFNANSMSTGCWLLATGGLAGAQRPFAAAYFYVCSKHDRTHPLKMMLQSCSYLTRAGVNKKQILLVQLDSNVGPPLSLSLCVSVSLQLTACVNVNFMAVTACFKAGNCRFPRQLLDVFPTCSNFPELARMARSEFL